ncbi:PadR family transcriptional regulator [Cytobacillus sp. FJAT-54145]|uniref:PadR family transcriptional regulator n=1 Tax=Cytobacillus spartinae TaxID=3299023 RepID=A0ABW6K9C9_9BACI
MKKTSPTQYLPLTHTTYYILISLVTPLHGYGIMQKVEEMSNGDVKLGPGTLYGALSKLEKEKLIIKTEEDEERRKCYILTELGKQVVKLEWDRLQTLVEVSRNLVESIEVEENL